MNYWFLYDSKGEIYGTPYLGDVDRWDNIPEGCEALGPFNADSTADSIKQAFTTPAYYRVINGILARKTDEEIQAIINAQPKPQPNEKEILGQQVAALTLSNGQKDAIIQQFGAQIVQMQLDITKLKGGAAT